MTRYQLLARGVRDTVAGLDIAPGQTGWSMYQDWLAAGGQPEPYRAPEVPLADRQSRAWSDIQEIRERIKRGGVLAYGKWFHTDDSSRIQQLGLTMMGATMPAGIQWKTMDGSFIEMAPTLAAQIFAAVAALDLAAFAAGETHRAAMLASATPETYDASAGWPEVYPG